jgi:hypothetical protein
MIPFQVQEAGKQHPALLFRSRQDTTYRNPRRGQVSTYRDPRRNKNGKRVVHKSAEVATALVSLESAPRVWSQTQFAIWLFCVQKHTTEPSNRKRCVNINRNSH